MSRIPGLTEVKMCPSFCCSLERLEVGTPSWGARPLAQVPFGAGQILARADLPRCDGAGAAFAVVLVQDNTFPATADVEVSDACFTADSDLDQVGGTAC